MKSTSEKYIDDLFTVADKMVRLKDIQKMCSSKYQVVIGKAGDPRLLSATDNMKESIKESSEKSLEKCWEEVKRLTEMWIREEKGEETE